MKRNHLFIDVRSRARYWLPVSVPCRSNGYLGSSAFGAKSAQYAKFIRKSDCADFAFGYSDIRSATSRHKRPALEDCPLGWKPVGSHPPQSHPAARIFAGRWPRIRRRLAPEHHLQSRSSPAFAPVGVWAAFPWSPPSLAFVVENRQQVIQRLIHSAKVTDVAPMDDVRVD